MIVLIFILIFAAVFLVISAVFLRETGPSASLMRKKDADTQDKAKRVKNPILHFLKILYPVNIPLSFIIGPKIRKKLAASGMPLNAADFIGLKEISIAACLFVTVFVTTSLLKKVDPVYYMLGGLIGYFLPDMILNSKIKQYKRSIAKDLPGVTDLLILCMDAGLNFVSALKWVIRSYFDCPLITELAIILQEINMGKPRREALKDMATRLDVQEVVSFVRIINQAERMGTSVAQTLEVLAEESEMRRFQRLERMALQAPIKLLLPLIFFIMPVILIIVGGPIVLEFMQQGAAAGVMGK